MAHFGDLLARTLVHLHLKGISWCTSPVFVCFYPAERYWALLFVFLGPLCALCPKHSD